MPIRNLFKNEIEVLMNWFALILRNFFGRRSAKIQTLMFLSFFSLFQNLWAQDSNDATHFASKTSVEPNAFQLDDAKWSRELNYLLIMPLNNDQIEILSIQLKFNQETKNDLEKLN